VSEREYDVAGVGGGEFALRLVPRQRAATLYWRSRSHTLDQNPLPVMKPAISVQSTDNVGPYHTQEMDFATLDLKIGQYLKTRWAFKGGVHLGCILPTL
jgi:hypothetical protein